MVTIIEGLSNLLSTFPYSALVEAVKVLRDDLDNLGSSLVLRLGSIPRQLAAVAREVDAGRVYMEVEAEHGYVMSCCSTSCYSRSNPSACHVLISTSWGYHRSASNVPFT